MINPGAKVMLGKIASYQEMFSPEVTSRLFGRHGSHIWNKYIKQCNQNLIVLYVYLSPQNQDKLAMDILRSQGESK